MKPDCVVLVLRPVQDAGEFAKTLEALQGLCQSVYLMAPAWDAPRLYRAQESVFALVGEALTEHEPVDETAQMRMVLRAMTARSGRKKKSSKTSDHVFVCRAGDGAILPALFTHLLRAHEALPQHVRAVSFALRHDGHEMDCLCGFWPFSALEDLRAAGAAGVVRVRAFVTAQNFHAVEFRAGNEPLEHVVF